MEELPRADGDDDLIGEEFTYVSYPAGITCASRGKRIPSTM